MHFSDVLVSRIQQKLGGGDLVRAGQQTSRDGNRGGDHDNAPLTGPGQPTDHATLVKILFKAAATAESP